MIITEVRRAWRSLSKSPALSAAAVVCLALGIGANTAIYSAANSLLSRSIPGVADPDRLVAIHRTVRSACCSENSYPVYRDLRDQSGVFSGVEAHYPLLSMTMAGSAEPERVWGQLVSPEYFSVLGVRLARGRAFSPQDVSAVVIADSLWTRRFGADPGIIGRTVTLNNGVFTVVGIAAPEFRGPDLGLVAEAWVPVGAIAQVMPQQPSLDDRSAPWLMIHARLKPGVTRGRAQAALDLLARNLERMFPGTDKEHGFTVEPSRSFHPAYRGAVLNAAAVSMVVAGLVLLVACANVANILLARSSARRKETATKIALGASRTRLIAEIVIESTTLSLAGGAVGVVLCFWLTRLAANFELPISAPLGFQIPVDLRALGFALALSIATGVLFGTLAGIKATRAAIVPALKGAPDGARRKRIPARDTLVVAQVAISALLLIVTILFLRSLSKLSVVPPGFRTDRLVLLDIDPRMRTDTAAVMARLRGRLAALPGIESASFTDIAPLSFAARAVNLKVPEGDASKRIVRADSFLVGPEYFATLGMPLVQGRDFVRADERLAPVVIVNQTAAKQLWPGADAVGRRLIRDGIAYEVAGIARDAKSRTLDEPRRPCAYFPFSQNHGRDVTPFGISLLVRTQGDSAAMVPAIRAEIRQLEPGLAVSNVRTIEQQLSNSLALQRLGAIVFGAAGAVGILLTSVGLYGVITYSIARRTRELGIRFAIGARREDAFRAVLLKAAALAGAGMAIGIPAAFGAARLASSFLYGVSAADPVTYAAVPALILSVALLASYVPARRAARVDPMVALRCD